MQLKYSIFLKLGHNKNLSKMELSTLMERLNTKQDFTWTEWKDYMFLDLEETKLSNLLSLLDYTGSIVKAGKIIAIVDSSDIGKINSILKKNLFNFISPPRNRKRKIRISLNIRSSKNQSKIIGHALRKTIYSQVKKYNFSVKILPRKRVSMELSPYEYYREKVFKGGIELNIFCIKSKIYMAITEWVTNPFFDIKLDEERPERLFTHGTSIKLARTMVFLSQTKKNGLVLDPFAGTGTILMMALLQDYSVIGTEKDPKCIRTSKENIRWLVREFNIDSGWDIYKIDSRKINQIIEYEKIDSIISEPYLGPFLKSLPNKQKGNEIIQNLEILYRDVINACAKILKNDSYIVFIIPSYEYDTGKIYIDIEKIAEENSLEIVKESKFFNISLPISIGRSHNIISRDLVILKKRT